MADIRDRDRDRHLHAHAQTGHRDNWGGNSGPSASQVAAVVTLLPVGGTLLALAGLTLVGTLIGLAVATPLFLLFSPVLVPAAFLTALAVTAFLASGLFGVTGLSSLSWVIACLREAAQRQLPEQLDHTKRRMADVAAYVGQKTKETGQTIQHKAHETAAARTTAST